MIARAIVGLLVSSLGAPAQIHRAHYVPGDDEIRAILQQRVEHEQQSTGVVVGVIDSSGERVIGDPGILDGDSIFEIGSLTKIFTAMLLSDMALRGEVKLGDPAAKYVPAKLPASISLQDLATHTSGLPRMPSNFAADGYTRQMLLDFLSRYEPPPNAEWKYSNLDYGVLGLAIAPDYETKLRSRITEPLEMNSTRVTLPPEDHARIAAGHDDHLTPVPASNFGALAPAAGLHSTANDLLKLLSAVLGYRRTSLAPAMTAMLNVRRATSTPGLTNALGWQISMPDGLEIVWKDGETPGYSSFLGFNAKAGVGVVVLSNTSTARGVNDIGMYILDGASQLFRRVR
ncbi:MAG TPA: serine hydrolase domain-containing protein [Bryobacteraceae bacterium]|nr:serine hydrolase domain-containing protein [Bryobacteraceae bacterium]